MIFKGKIFYGSLYIHLLDKSEVTQSVWMELLHLFHQGTFFLDEKVKSVIFFSWILLSFQLEEEHLNLEYGIDTKILSRIKFQKD